MKLLLLLLLLLLGREDARCEKLDLPWRRDDGSWKEEACRNETADCGMDPYHHDTRSTTGIQNIFLDDIGMKHEVPRVPDGRMKVMLGYKVTLAVRLWKF